MRGSCYERTRNGRLSHRSLYFFDFMTTRRRSSATKSAKSTVKKSQVISVTKSKYSQPIAIKKVTETPTAPRVRPEKPNLSFEDYKADVKVRWEIHQWETQELWKDCVWGYQQTKPIVQKVVTYCVDSYNRAFNETEGQKAN